VSQSLVPHISLNEDEILLSLEEAIKLGLAEDYNELVLLSNMEFAQNLFYSLPQDSNYNLTESEFLSIYYYSLEWTNNNHLYLKLNQALNSKQREIDLVPWKHYLYYLLSALRKIPKWIGNQDVYRAVLLNIVEKYPTHYSVGSTITWYGFSSTTTKFEIIKNFLKESNTGTIFTINGTFSGRFIGFYSAHQNESEILLPPCSRFEVISTSILGGFNFIQLKQIPSLDILLDIE